MSALVDTSGILAILDKDDKHHADAEAAWHEMLAIGEHLVCTSYVLIESFALLQNRLGLQAVRDLHERIRPLLEVEWIDEALHEDALRPCSPPTGARSASSTASASR